MNAGSLQGAAMLCTCTSETLQMQRKYPEADGFSHGLAETDVNQDIDINLFRLGQNLVL